MNDRIEHDRQARQQALNPKQSFIVQAPAGSGKTELLIQRYLTLLNTVTAPEEILAITFTKKAANEMRARVLKALKQALYDPKPTSAHSQQTWQLAKNVLARDQQFNWHLIENPNQLRIQTIDSLCSYLTKQLPLLSHFGAQPDLAEIPNFLYEEAVREILSHVEEDFPWSQDIINLLTHLDNDLNKLHKLLIHALTKRDQWLPHLHLSDNTKTPRQQLESQLARIIQEKIQLIREVFPTHLIAAMMDVARFAAENVIQNNVDSPIAACRDLINLPDTSNQTAWHGIAELLLTAEEAWRKQVNYKLGFPALSDYKNKEEKALRKQKQEQWQYIISQLTEHEPVRMALAELFHLPRPQYEDQQWQILSSLLNLLKIAAAQLRITFQQQRQIDFIENAQAALLALGTENQPTDLALALDYQIKHILVDEFQDTSSTQYQLLEKLIAGWMPDDGRTLFVVGDPMQSIYRFREAEVGLFIRMREEGIGGLSLTPLTLSVNFRSTPAIVDWNNNIFNQLFPIRNDMTNGAVAYSPSTTLTAAEPTQAIYLHGFVDASSYAQEKFLVQLIQERQMHAPHERIAILVRARSHLSQVILELKKANIPYRAIDIDPLSEKQIIIDLLSLTLALLHPHDRIAWLAILRAPWCGLTLADLHIIANQSEYAPIFSQLERQDILNQLSEDGRQRILRILPILKAKIAERERYHLRYRIESTWLLLGGPACLSTTSDQEDVEVYFSLLDELSQDEQILSIDQLTKRIERLYASAHHDEQAVQIMTIHTAKGLEFDTVIIPHLEKQMPADDKSLLLWLEQPLSHQENALMLAPIHAANNKNNLIYDYIARQQKIKSHHEIDRLLYVATTRAKQQLYLLFDTKTKNEELVLNSGSFLQKLWPLVKHSNQLQLIQTVSTYETNEIAAQPERVLKRLSTSWHNPIQLPSSQKVAFHQQQNGFQFQANTPQLLGTALHRILQLFAINGWNEWQQMTEDNRHRYLRIQLIQVGILPNALTKSIQLMLTIINKTLNDARGRWILTPHLEAKSEFAITATIDSMIKKLVIDRMFIDNNICWIIDYKTTAFTNEELNAFLAHEQEKYLEKMHLYARAIKMRVAQPIKLGLYFPALSAWQEWDFIE